jgi:hypothetical protein
MAHSPLETGIAESRYKKNKKARNELAPRMAAVTRTISARALRAVKDMELAISAQRSGVEQE